MRSFYHYAVVYVLYVWHAFLLLLFCGRTFLIIQIEKYRQAGTPTAKNLSSGCLKIFCRHTGGKGYENYIKHSVAPL